MFRSKSSLPTKALWQQTCYVGQVFFLPSGLVSRSRSVCYDHRSVAERMVLGSALNVFQKEKGLPRSKRIFSFAFKVAWPRCGRTPQACCWCRGAWTSKQELKVDRGAYSSNTLPSFAAAARHQPLWRRRTGSVTLSWDQKSRFLVRSCATRVSVIRQIDDISSVVRVTAPSQVQNSSSGLMPKQFIPSELLGRVVGGLHWHVVGVEPPRRVCHELDDVRVTGTLKHCARLRHNSSFPQILMHSREECFAELHSSRCWSLQNCTVRE